MVQRQRWYLWIINNFLIFPKLQMNNLPESRNHNPVIVAIWSSAQFKDELYKALISYQNKTWISIPNTSDNLKWSDFDIYFFSDQIDDRLLPNILKKWALVVSSNKYPNKMILHELKWANKIKLYNTVDEISQELSLVLHGFEKIWNNMNYIDQSNPKTWNIFWRNGWIDRKCPAIVTNNIKSWHEFNCIGFDDFNDQEYSTGNGEIEYLNFVWLKERLEKNRKWQNPDLIIKNLKLRITQMKNLTL